MNSTLLKLAILGTDAQPSDFNFPSLAPFAETFAALKSSPPKAALLAAGVDAALDEVQTPTPNPELAELARVKPIERDALIPLDVADEIIKTLELYANSYYAISDDVQETRLLPVEILLRAMARYGRKIPPERAARFMRVLAQIDFKALDEGLELGAALGTSITRDLAKLETNLMRACRLATIFLEPYDRPQGVALDAIAAKIAHGEGVNERADALAALRYLAPQRARELVAEFFKSEKPDRRRRLLEPFAVRLELDDATFLEEIVEKDRSNEVKELAFDFLAKLRETQYASEITKLADSILAPNGEITIPEASAKLKKLGVLAIYAPAQKKREQTEELVARALRRVPLEHWENVFNAPPTEILAKIEGNPDFPIILNGLRASLALFAGPRAWEEPLARVRECDKDHRKEIIWTRYALKRIPPQDVESARNAVDRVLARAKDAPQRLQQALALLLAFYEPYPWRESFANSFDEIASDALRAISPTVYQTLQEASNDFTAPVATVPDIGRQTCMSLGSYVADLVAPVFPALPARLLFKYRLPLTIAMQNHNYYYDCARYNPHPLIAELRHGKALKRILDADDLLATFDKIRQYFASLEETNE